jgi:hypothetical protein
VKSGATGGATNGGSTWWVVGQSGVKSAGMKHGERQSEGQECCPVDNRSHDHINGI